MLMYDFDSIDATYEFDSTVTFANGKKTTFRKVEHVTAKKVDESYVFTMQGSSEEIIDGDEPDGWDVVVLRFGKALYPYSLKVERDGGLSGVLDFEKVKAHWFDQRQQIIDYYNDYYIEKESNRYALALKSEEKFFQTLKDNLFYSLFFWSENQPDHQVVIRDFPSRTRLAIFTFKDKRYDDKGDLSYETGLVKDEGSGRLLSGQASLQFIRGKEGLPKEIRLKARVEEADTGYFTKEITIKRL